MITSEELKSLRAKYDNSPTAVPVCSLCGADMMTYRGIQGPEGTLRYRCLTWTGAPKYTREWWAHVERSAKGSEGDPLVMKLIEAYERMIGGQNPVQR